jgi:hypothetical protein
VSATTTSVLLDKTEKKEMFRFFLIALALASGKWFTFDEMSSLLLTHSLTLALYVLRQEESEDQRKERKKKKCFRKLIPNLN